ncbi:MAG: helix-turn-helix domain-containing protein [Dyella sp.]|uniref:helix-turn-helix domain-containing protein n=1 Tax=Dyella sp. TaxID=1869338 RepID=UPI003F7D96FF
MSTFAERLAQERAKLGKSQAEFAKMAGVARSAQANYESGTRAPDATYLQAVAEHGVDVQYLLSDVRSGSVDSTTMGLCEAAIRHAFADARPSAEVIGYIRISALCKVYNAVMERLVPSADVALVAAEAAAQYVQFIDDPADTSLLARALFRDSPALVERPGAVIAKHQSIAAGGDLNIGKGAGRKR